MRSAEAKNFAKKNTRLQKFGMSQKWSCYVGKYSVSAELRTLPQAASDAKIGFLILSDNRGWPTRETEQEFIDDLAEAKRKFEFFKDQLADPVGNDIDDRTRVRFEDLMESEISTIKYLENNTFTTESVGALGEGFLETIVSEISSQKFDVLLIPLLEENPAKKNPDDLAANHASPLFEADMPKYLSKIPKAIKLKSKKLNIVPETMDGFGIVNLNNSPMFSGGKVRYLYAYDPKRIETLKTEFFEGKLFLPEALSKLKGSGSIVGRELVGKERIFHMNEMFTNTGNLARYFKDKKDFPSLTGDSLLGLKGSARELSRLNNYIRNAADTIDYAHNYEAFKERVKEALIDLQYVGDDLKVVQESIDNALVAQKQISEHRVQLFKSHSTRMSKGQNFLNSLKEDDEKNIQDLLTNPLSLLTDEELDNYKEEYLGKSLYLGQLWRDGLNKSDFEMKSSPVGHPLKFLEKHKEHLQNPHFLTYLNYELYQDSQENDKAKEASVEYLNFCQNVWRKGDVAEGVSYENLANVAGKVLNLKLHLRQRKLLIDTSPLTQEKANEFADGLEITVAQKIKKSKDPLVQKDLSNTIDRIRKVTAEFYRLINGNVDPKRLKSFKINDYGYRANADMFRQQVNIKLDEPESTIYHELFHFLEFENADVHEAGQVLLMDKIQNLKLKTLTSIEKKESGRRLHQFESSEKGFETGGSVSSAYLAKSYGSSRNSSEAITMMCQDLMCAPTMVRANRRKMKDFPDELKFAYGMIQDLRDGGLGKGRRDLAGFRSDVAIDEAIRKGYMGIRTFGMPREHVKERLELIPDSEGGGTEELLLFEPTGPLILKASNESGSKSSNDFYNVVVSIKLIGGLGPLYVGGLQSNTTSNLKLIDGVGKRVGYSVAQELRARNGEWDAKELSENEELMDYCRESEKYLCINHTQDNETWVFPKDGCGSKYDWKLFEDTGIPMSSRFDSNSSNMRK